jgi:hypothetical protein
MSPIRELTDREVDAVSGGGHHGGFTFNYDSNNTVNQTNNSTQLGGAFLGIVAQGALQSNVSII